MTSPPATTGDGIDRGREVPARDGPVPVAVTGIGIVSPLGVGREAFWAALSAGRSGIVPLEGLARDSGLPRIGAPAAVFDARALIASPHLRRMDRLSRMAVAASRLALDDAGIDAAHLVDAQTGIVLGTTLGDLEDSITHLERVFTRGPAAASPMIFPNLVMNAPAAYVAMEHGLTGPNLTVAQHEVTGEHAVVLGCDLIRSGRADLVLAGGGDELSAILVEGYHRARALAGQRGGREWASPYDAERSGVVLGEGAALLALEPLAIARSRGAAIHALIGETSVYSVPAPRYDWPARAPGAVAALAPLTADGAVDLIAGSACSSRRLDGCELALFGALLGRRAAEVFVTSIKGAVGELGAGGALTIAAACLALREQAVPPLCSLRRAEAGAPFRFAAGRAVPAPLRGVLVSGLARGGSGVGLRLDRA